MTITPTPGALKKFRRTAWRFQQTVQRPGPDALEHFVGTILSAHEGLESVTVTIDAVIFGTDRIKALCPPGVTLTHDVALAASNLEEAQALLVAAFFDGPDFVCVPTPKPFVFYADHDDWITFYANTKSHLNRVIEPLRAAGYQIVEGWRREF